MIILDVLTKVRRSFFYHLKNGKRGININTSEKLQCYYNSTFPRCSNINTTIIVMIDGKIKHGGIVDRLRGMVSVYQFAKKNKIDFKIYHCKPFSLTNYLIPNELDWIINEEDLCFNNHDSLPIYLESYNYYYEKKFQTRVLKETISKSFRQYHVYTNMDSVSNSFSKLFNELFKPSYVLNNSINWNLKQINCEYSAFVFRFQQLLGDFEEGDYPELPDIDKSELIDRCVKKVVDLKFKLIKERKVLITSDSLTFLNAVSKLDFVYVIPGKVVHIDYTENAEEDVYLKSFNDFFMLTKANSVYLIRTGEMYKSGFAKKAAMVSNLPYYEINF